MKKLILLSFISLLATSAVWAGEKVKIKVKGMVCSFCAQGLDKKFKAEPTVDKVKVSVKETQIELDLKPDQELTDERIKFIVEDAGYNVQTIKRESK